MLGSGGPPSRLLVTYGLFEADETDFVLFSLLYNVIFNELFIFLIYYNRFYINDRVLSFAGGLKVLFCCCSRVLYVYEILSLGVAPEEVLLNDFIF